MRFCMQQTLCIGKIIYAPPHKLIKVALPILLAEDIKLLDPLKYVSLVGGFFSASFSGKLGHC